MAARMVPARGNTKFGFNLAEQVVFDALQKQLPDGSVVVYDYLYAAIERNTFYDGQVDFIAVVPRVGVCFIEVKGARRFEYRDSRWHRHDGAHTVVIDDPFEQCTKNKHRVVALTLQRLGWTTFPAHYGYLVIYPNGELVGEAMPMAHPRELLVTKKEMPRLGDIVVDTIHRSGDRRIAFEGKSVDAFVEGLTIGGALVPVVAADVEAERSDIESLTADQHVAWQSLLAGARVVVIGPAGSGKTVLAVARAKQFWQQTGGRVLLTCYNRRLAEAIRLREELDTPWQIEGTPGLAPGIHVCHFHDLASFYINDVAGRRDDWKRLSAKHGADAFFRDVVPALLDEATDRLTEEWRFDGVVIDEGQDFENLWLSKVQLLLKDPAHGPVMLCLGDGQRLFSADRQYVSNVDTVQVLHHNCRNTRHIGSYAARAGGVPSKFLPGAPDGTSPVLLPYFATLDERVAAAARVVQDWLDQGLPASSIAVLSPMVETNNLGSIPGIGARLAHGTTSDVRQWKGGQAVWASTIRAFKGMEADCVVLTDLPSAGPNFTRDDLYVAVSRPRSRLVIIPGKAEAFAELRAFLV